MLFFGFLLAVAHFIDTFWTVFCSCHLYARPSYDGLCFSDLFFFAIFNLLCFCAFLSRGRFFVVA